MQGPTPLGKLKKPGAGLHGRLQDVILTHFHPDHVGRRPEYVDEYVVDWSPSPHARFMGCITVSIALKIRWKPIAGKIGPTSFRFAFHRLSERRDGVTVLDNVDFHITAYPVTHFVPTIGPAHCQQAQWPRPGV